MKNCVVIPAYNEESTIASVVNSIRSLVDVIVVDDSSTDGTAAVAQELDAIVVSTNTNLGYDWALQRGFEEADRLGMDNVITFDADGQHDPAAVEEALYQLENMHVDLVLGIRSHSARVSEAIFNFYTWKRYGIPDLLCGLKGYSMALYRKQGWYSSYESVGTELALFGIRQHVKFALVKVGIHERTGHSRFDESGRANLKIIKAFLKAF